MFYIPLLSLVAVTCFNPFFYFIYPSWDSDLVWFGSDWFGWMFDCMFNLWCGYTLEVFVSVRMGLNSCGGLYFWRRKVHRLFLLQLVSCPPRRFGCLILSVCLFQVMYRSVLPWRQSCCASTFEHTILGHVCFLHGISAYPWLAWRSPWGILFLFATT